MSCSADERGLPAKFSVQMGLISNRDVHLHTLAQACANKSGSLHVHQVHYKCTNVGTLPEIGSRRRR